MQVTVLGAGVIGLTTALVLEREGHDVTVVAREKGGATTSGVAGAVWLPFNVGPPHRALAWAHATRTALTDIASSSIEAGVDMVDAYLAAEDETPPWWAPAVPEMASVHGVQGLGDARAWKMRVPRCDPRLYLPWLEARLHRAVTLRDVASLETLAGDCVVNCAGARARRLVPDESLVPNLGQIVVARGVSLDAAVMLSDDRQKGALFYVIPRRGEFVLGGTAIDVDEVHPPHSDGDLSRAILERCSARGIVVDTVLGAYTGLRPTRPEVRLEREGRVMHNYGHGGAGYTLSWGCAEEVASLLRAW